MTSCHFLQFHTDGIDLTDLRIKQLHIRNFWGINELHLDFTYPGSEEPLDMVVLAGPNGCGKTSVLEACLLLLNQGHLIQRRKEMKLSDYIRKGAEDFEIKAVLVYHNQEIAATLTSESGFEFAEEMKVDYFSSWRAPRLVGSVSVNLGKKGKSPSETEENRLWLLKQYLVNLTASKAFEGSQLTIFNEEKDAYEQLNRMWRFFYSDRREKFVARRVSEDIAEGFDIFLEGRMEYPVPLDHLSSGEIEVLTLIGQHIRKNKAEDIIFIDEPELHLHSAWHRTILRVLREVNQGTQIICASHSQEVLDSVYSYERFTLLPERDPRIYLNPMEKAEEVSTV